MTKKDFILIANAVRKAATECSDPTAPAAALGAVSTVAHNLADALATTNPRFDRRTFLVACGVEL